MRKIMEHSRCLGIFILIINNIMSTELLMPLSAISCILLLGIRGQESN